jgi:hypothetical protein
VSPVEVFADQVRVYFEQVHQEVFADDPASNPCMSVEVIGAATAKDTPVVILIAPWTLCGLALPPDGRLVSTLRVGHSHYPALVNEVDKIGSYWSVMLVPDVSGYTSQEEARHKAQSLAEPFCQAVEKARQELTEVADADRRSLFNTVAGKPESAAPVGTAFGSPDGSSSPTQGG